MFLFRRKKQPDLFRMIRRFIDRSSPVLPPSSGESRWEDRSNRTIPVLLAPRDGESVCSDEATFAITKNLSDHGLALVLPHPFRAESVVIGFWHADAPYFVLGSVRQNVPLGGGFWQVGLELHQMLTMADHPDLMPLASLAGRLDPSLARQALAATTAVRV